MLTDDDRRLLTELLGEVWDKEQSCPHCGYYCTGKTAFCLPPVVNRTFTSWQDLGDLKEKIVEMGEWRTFYRWAHEDDFCNWFMNPERFCELVAKWWKERRKG